MADQDIDKMFAEYDSRVAAKREKNDRLRIAAHEGAMAAAKVVVETIFPALEAFAVELREKNCKVELARGGQGTGVDENASHPRARIHIWQPDAGKADPAAFEGTFIFGPQGPKYSFKSRIRGNVRDDSHGFAADITQENVRDLVLMRFREVLEALGAGHGRSHGA